MWIWMMMMMIIRLVKRDWGEKKGKKRGDGGKR